MSDYPTLSNNTLTVIALSNEYCQAVEQASTTGREDFENRLLRLLPRIYIAVSDIPEGAILDNGYIQPALDEEGYDEVRRNVSAVMAEDDTYLDVFQEDMKYSDTPITASVSEGAADLFQVLYNYVEAVREAPSPVIDEATQALRTDFADYWSCTLCNLFRAINALRYN